MLKTIRGDDGKPYISLEDMIQEVINSKNELESKLNEDIPSESIEFRIEFLNKLYESFKQIEEEYYKQILGYRKKK